MAQKTAVMYYHEAVFYRRLVLINVIIIRFIRFGIYKLMALMLPPPATKAPPWTKTETAPPRETPAPATPPHRQNLLNFTN